MSQWAQNTIGMNSWTRRGQTVGLKQVARKQAIEVWSSSVSPHLHFPPPSALPRGAFCLFPSKYKKVMAKLLFVDDFIYPTQHHLNLQLPTFEPLIASAYFTWGEAWSFEHIIPLSGEQHFCDSVKFLDFGLIFQINAHYTSSSLMLASIETKLGQILRRVALLNFVRQHTEGAVTQNAPSKMTRNCCCTENPTFSMLAA